ncbi:MAG TPA: dihydrolipoamide acetyltransferase family protein [Streptosporangiaceae bacterium]|jgi:pyruvate dehydrogenase E2 component (dihydrolipoamide acetyltransferase)
MSELKEFRLPDVGEGLTEADIVKWHVQPGDRVTINQIIVEIETAKAVVELPSPFEGVVAGLLVAEGQTVDVGTPIVTVSTGEGAAAGPAGPGETAAAEAAGGAEVAEAVATEAQESGAADAAPAAAEQPGTADPGPAGGGPAGNGPGGGDSGAAGPAAEPKPERQAVLVGYGVKLGRTTRRARKSTSGPPAAPAPAAASVSAASDTATPDTEAPVTGAPANGAHQTAAQTLAKPLVRKLARDLGVDLAGLAGSGPHGSITRDDVQQAAQPAAAAGPTAASQPITVAAGPREERVPIRGVRKHTAAAVTASAFTAPHVTEFVQVDVTGTTEALGRIRELPDFAGLRVSPLLLAARALMIAVARHPMINSSWDEAAQEIVVKRYVNLGIAASTERGLVVPNIKDAQAMTLPELARALSQLTETARSGKTSPADLSHGTITITNVGVFGVDSGTPILTPGETAILCLGRIKDAPWVHEGQLAVRKVTTLALSFDHRIVDGDLGSAVLSEVGAMMEDPVRMLAWT